LANLNTASQAIYVLTILSSMQKKNIFIDKCTWTLIVVTASIFLFTNTVTTVLTVQYINNPNKSVENIVNN
jgi:hypothetical protein